MRIFVSHGIDKSDPAQVDFLGALVAALNQPTPGGRQHEALVDNRVLEAGDNWSQVLYDCLDECDHALLLLSPRALTRPWVWQEATILSFRQRRHGGFRLYPVLLDGVTPERVQGHAQLGALDLTRLQAFAPGSSAAAVAAQVHAGLDQLPQPADNQLDTVAEAIAAQLARVPPQNLGKLHVLCEQLRAPLAFTSSAQSRRLGLALARAIVGRRLQPVQGLAGLLQRLTFECGLDDEAVRNVRELAAPLWVEASVSDGLALHRAASVDTPPYAAALYARLGPYSARMAVHRLQLPRLPLPKAPPAVITLSLPQADDSEQGQSQALCNALCDAYAEKRFGMDRATADLLLQALTEPQFVLLPPPVPPTEVLRLLRQRYAQLVFIAHTGHPPPAAHELPPGVWPLPPIAAALELANFTDYNHAGGNS